MVEEFHSWGRIGSVLAESYHPVWLEDLNDVPRDAIRLPFGLGRSYGDSCLLNGGHMMVTTHLDRLISFDVTSGILRAEAGISLDAILRFAVPRGWFLPTTPGTRFVTLGGAIANDVHGKNHHTAGTFGCHIPRFCLLRSDGTQHECTASQNPELYRATIGGLGLTGVIAWADIRLVPIQSSFLDVELVRFHGLDEFLAITAESESTGWEYTVAWVDSLAQGRSRGRGIFMRGNHSRSDSRLVIHRNRGLTVPFDFPSIALGEWNMRPFNSLYYRRFTGRHKRLTQHYAPFFYPLDATGHWTRIYGKRGLYQYQCSLPFEAGNAPMEEIFAAIAASGLASFLAVLKTFGVRQSPGMLSFPSPGITLALDFPNRGAATLGLFDRLDAILRSAHGRLYPAKDARMAACDFIRCFPELDTFRRHVDPMHSSDFWRRMATQERSV